MQQKLITFAVPCYNSAAYMRHCIETLLSAGEQAEIILVDDGSVKDETPAICDEYAAKYPTIVKAIHQENGGHGEGVNQGIRNATGLYYKVVDSDDTLSPDFPKFLDALEECERQGGVEGMQQLKHARAAKVYDFLDNSALFHPCAQPGSRSDMNVTFRTGDDALDKEFISGAAARGLLNLKGHRVAGGMRASLYNAMPMAGVDALVDYLKQFEVEHHV